MAVATRDKEFVFEVRMKLAVDKNANFLPVVENMMARAVKDIIKDVIFDIDDLKILEIKVKEK